MGKKAELSISESIEKLEKLYSRQATLQKQKRVLALLRIKRQDDSTREDLANYLGVHIRTLERWIKSYKQGKIAGLVTDLPRRTGSKIITPEIHRGLQDRVNSQKNSFKGYWDAQRWIEKEYGVKVKYQRVREYLIQYFGTKVKTPRKSHVNKDDGAVALFKNAN